MIRLRIGAEHAGKRLDAAIAENFPELGLRGRRRLLEGASLNGRPASFAAKVRPGDELAIPEVRNSSPPGTIVAIQPPFFFLFKPVGLHSAKLAGGRNPALEDQLPLLLPDAPSSRLLQRLDEQTCGLVAGCADEAGKKLFRQAEAAGRCKKRYLALLSGMLERPALMKNLLDVDDRKKTIALCGEGPPERWTDIRPLWHCGNSTWALCSIRRGHRHQIRAHAAACGFPLVGDGLYGGGDGQFCLRQFHIGFEGFSCVDLVERPGAFAVPGEVQEALKPAIQRLAG